MDRVEKSKIGSKSGTGLEEEKVVTDQADNQTNEPHG